MHNVEFPIGSLPTIEAEMSALQSHISSYRNAVNQEGIWLFLTTLGCWGVPNHILQIFSFALAALLFGERATNRLKETRSFSQLVKDIEERIAQLLPDGDARKARLYDLAAFQRTELSTLNNLKNIRVFLLCWLFYSASLVFCLYMATLSIKH